MYTLEGFSVNMMSFSECDSICQWNGNIIFVCVCVWGGGSLCSCVVLYLNKSNKITSPFLNANREQDNYG